MIPLSAFIHGNFRYCRFRTVSFFSIRLRKFVKKALRTVFKLLVCLIKIKYRTRKAVTLKTANHSNAHVRSQSSSPIPLLLYVSFSPGFLAVAESCRAPLLPNRRRSYSGKEKSSLNCLQTAPFI